MPEQQWTYSNPFKTMKINDRKVDREMQKIFSERNYEWILANYNLLSSKKIFRMWEQ
jgi:hypothetical protein